jgi:hypothetical protein
VCDCEYIYIYIYIDRERERERERGGKRERVIWWNGIEIIFLQMPP